MGERVFLRFLEARDLEEFLALNRSSKRLHRGLVTPPTRPEQFRTLLRRCRKPDVVCFVACRLEDGVMVGFLTISQIFRGPFKSAYLGYYVGAEHARQGFTSAAIDLLLKYAFDRLRLHRLEANIQPENRASIAVVRRAGFVREGYSKRYLKVSGRWCDHERWAIIAEDWRAQRRSRAAK